MKQMRDALKVLKQALAPLTGWQQSIGAEARLSVWIVVRDLAGYIKGWVASFETTWAPDPVDLGLFLDTVDVVVDHYEALPDGAEWQMASYLARLVDGWIANHADEDDAVGGLSALFG